MGLKPDAMKRAVIATIAAVLVWSIQDILVWQRLFEAHGLYQYDAQYQFWHSAFLIALIAIAVAVAGPCWGLWSAAAIWTLANSGLADVLYYWLDGRPIPQTLPWLDQLHPLIFFHPATNTTVVISAAIWLGLCLISLPAMTRSVKR